MAALSASEEAVIKTRLTTRTQVANGPAPLTKLTRRWLTMVQEAGTEGEAKEESYQAFLKELCLFEQQAGRVNAVIRANTREQDNYQKMEQELETGIETVRTEMEALKTVLEDEKVTRNHKEEYEVLRKLCMDHPPRAETEAAIAAVQESIERLEKETGALDAKLDLRKKQFSLVMHAVDELQRELEDEPYDTLMEAGEAPVDGDAMET